MKKIITLVTFVVILTLGVNPLYAHGDAHSHSNVKINEVKAKEIALIQVKNFVLAGKLDKSWTNVKVDNMKQQTYQSMPEWIFTFKNPKEPNPKQQNFYIFVNQYGQMTGANFTGE